MSAGVEPLCPPLQYSRTRIQYFETIYTSTSSSLNFGTIVVNYFLIRPEFIQSGFKCVSRFCTHNFIIAIVRLHHAHQLHKTRAIATDWVAWSVCVSASLSVCHVHEHWTDRNAVRLGSDLCNYVLDGIKVGRIHSPPGWRCGPLTMMIRTTMMITKRILTVHRMLILPKPQHPKMQTGSGLLLGALCTRCTAAGVVCWLFACWVIPACAVERPGRNNAVRSATCCPRIPFIVDRNRCRPSAEVIRWSSDLSVPLRARRVVTVAAAARAAWLFSQAAIIIPTA